MASMVTSSDTFDPESCYETYPMMLGPKTTLDRRIGQTKETTTRARFFDDANAMAGCKVMLLPETITFKAVLAARVALKRSPFHRW